MKIKELKQNIIQQLYNATGIDIFDTIADYDITDDRPTHAIIRNVNTTTEDEIGSCDNVIFKHTFQIILHMELTVDDFEEAFDKFVEIYESLQPDAFYKTTNYKIILIDNFSNIDYLGKNASTSQMAYIQTFDVIVRYYE